MKHESARVDIVGVGHICYDHICVIDGYPDEDESMHIEEMYNQPGGAASQAIATVARLGGRAGYLGCLGDDGVGTFLFKDCQAEGVDTSQVQVIAGGISSSSIVLADSRNAKRTLFSYHDRLPPYNFTREAMDYIGAASFLHLDGTMYDNAFRAARIARAAKTKVSLDGCSMQKDNAKNLALVGMVDILIMNEKYPSRLMEDDNRERALLNIAKIGPEIVLSTSGEKGCLLVREGRIEAFPAYRVEPVDTTGAGDSFHGAFLFGLTRGYSIEENIRFSSAVSAINCLSIGGRAGIPGFDQVRRFMAENDYSFQPGRRVFAASSIRT